MKNIIVYTKPTCPYCVKAKETLKAKEIAFEERDADAPEVFTELQDRVKLSRITVPQIFVGDYRIGGFDNLSALVEANLLDDVINA